MRNLDLHLLLIVLLFYRAEYYEGLQAGICRDESHVIREKEECWDAIRTLGIGENTYKWTGAADDIPQGCSIGRETSHFETSKGGLGTGRWDLTPICRKKGNILALIFWC